MRAVVSGGVDHSSGGVRPSTAQEQQRLLLSGVPHLTAASAAEAAGVSLELLHTFWRAMGFPNVGPDEAIFADIDVQALRSATDLVEAGVVDAQTLVALLRAHSHSADRLGLWQVEAYVDDVARRLGLDDTSARLILLDRIGEMVDPLESFMRYAWRRHLAALLGRIDAAVATRGAERADDELPLERAIGFVDVVAYTTRTAHLGARALATLVQGFEFAARDVVTTAGARVVKTLGDAVMFVADDLPTCVDVALDLVRALDDAPVPLPVRGAVTWGRILSRSGDVFGPVVNLASRLADVAAEGEILLDSSTAAELEVVSGIEAYRLKDLPVIDVDGMGRVRPVRVGRPDGSARVHD